MTRSPFPNSCKLMVETNIILAVIGCVGLLSTLAVYSRANRAVTKYEQLLKK
jgi:hypothetical protein